METRSTTLVEPFQSISMVADRPIVAPARETREDPRFGFFDYPLVVALDRRAGLCMYRRVTRRRLLADKHKSQSVRTNLDYSERRGKHDSRCTMTCSSPCAVSGTAGTRMSGLGEEKSEKVRIVSRGICCPLRKIQSFAIGFTSQRTSSRVRNLSKSRLKKLPARLEK